MKDFALQLYHAMQEEVACCKRQQLPLIKEIESCYQVVQKSSQILNEQLENYRFLNCESEIAFFKTIKPLFAAEIEYYHLVYHAEIFKPPDPVEQAAFWQRETRRLEEFRIEQISFLEYYESGDTTKDAQFFLRTSYLSSKYSKCNVYEFGAHASTTYDHLISVLYALEKYTLYVNDQRLSISNEIS